MNLTVLAVDMTIQETNWALVGWTKLGPYVTTCGTMHPFDGDVLLAIDNLAGELSYLVEQHEDIDAVVHPVIPRNIEESTATHPFFPRHPSGPFWDVDHFGAAVGVIRTVARAAGVTVVPVSVRDVVAMIHPPETHSELAMRVMPGFQGPGAQAFPALIGLVACQTLLARNLASD